MNQQPNFDIYIGRSFLEVGKEIKNNFGDKYKIQVLTYGSFTTCDFVTRRIRVYLDVNNLIEHIRIG